ncbi:MAG: hypothetical protein K2P06_06325 [Muribaculaceae bacterium]|nr:hypothetical protein [Muribaculaceae bacterium]
MKKILSLILFIALGCAVNARTLYVEYTTTDGTINSVEVTDADGKFVLDLDDLKKIEFSLSDNPDLIDEQLYFELDPSKISRKVAPKRQSYFENPGSTALPVYGSYHIEIAADLSYGIFMTRMTDELFDGIPCYVGPQADGKKKVENEFVRLSETEFELDCSGHKAIPAFREFTIHLFERRGDGASYYDYGTARLTTVSDDSYWENGKNTMLDEPFEGKIRLTRIPGSPEVVRIVMQP